MARPLKEGMDYFPHDTDAANDEKIEALRALHGNDGYAFYFILLERIYRTSSAELDVSKTAILAALIKKIGVSMDKFNEILETAFDINCLDREQYENRCVLTSNGIRKRFTEVNKIRENWRKRKESREENYRENHKENPGDNPGETRQSKVKESKEKKSKKESKDLPSVTEVSFADNVKMTEAEHSKLIDKFGPADTGRMIEILSGWKHETGKGVTKKDYASDYGAIMNWVVVRMKEDKSRAAPIAPVDNKESKYTDLYVT
jgi:hypothetical protein